MAPLPPNSTGRVFVDYTANGREHTVQFRYSGAGAPDTSFLEGLDDVFIEMNPYMPSDWTFLGWRYVADGNVVSVDLPGGPTAFNGAGVPVVGEAPAFLSFIGRSLGGRRLRVYFLGTSASPADDGGDFADYRVDFTESPGLLDVVNAMTAAGVVAIDGGPPAWKNYANLGYNAYWQRKVRS